MSATVAQHNSVEEKSIITIDSDHEGDNKLNGEGDDGYNNGGDDADESDGEASIDEEQLDEYREMIDDLGSFPDKVIINSLSMVAEDHATSKSSASKIYGCIRSKLQTVSSDRKLPLVYVIDSILKNVKGLYISLIEKDAKVWLPDVYRALRDDARRSKLKKVWRTWKEFKIFQESCWKDMGTCFGPSKQEEESKNIKEEISSAVGGSASAATAAARAKDGSLKLSPALRKEMQKILDELQNEITDELDKVSLERLAGIDPDLFNQIIVTGKENINKSKERQMMQQKQQQINIDEVISNNIPHYFTEIRSQEVLKRSSAWDKLDLNHAELAQEITEKLQQLSRENSSPDCRYTQQEAIEMMYVLACASTTASMLEDTVQESLTQEDNTKNQSFSFFPGLNTNTNSGNISTAIDKTLFTNEGIKKKNDTVVRVLYEVGLPFVSSSDGRRFATQLKLSNHLDALFKKSQIEKLMARTEERGWYSPDSIWTGENIDARIDKHSGIGIGNLDQATDLEESDPSSFTVPADESRDRCAICGTNFNMVFDNDDGIYKYNNCHEIKVTYDEVAVVESEMKLVKVTCWRGLGMPSELTADQTIQ